MTGSSSCARRTGRGDSHGCNTPLRAALRLGARSGGSM